jgi:hypothetical protein
MKLKVTDQIHVSYIQADTLRPNDEVVVTAEQGESLLKAHPDKFEKLSNEEPAAKAEPAPENKMEAAPTNKAAGKQKAK